MHADDTDEEGLGGVVKKPATTSWWQTQQNLKQKKDLEKKN